MKMIKLFFVFPLIAQAQTVWVQGAKTSFNEFKAHVQALEQKTFAEAQLKELREKTKTFLLEKRIRTAQQLYLSGDLSEAQKTFEEITNQIYLGDWNKEQREILFYSLLRQAQSSKEKERRKALMKTAGLFIGSQVSLKDLNSALFPPPFWKEMKKVREEIPLFSISWRRIFPHHQTILINGEQVSYKETISLPEGTYRITALSSSHAPWFKITSPSLLLAQPLKFSPLTKGICEFEKIKSQWSKPYIKIFSQSTCPALLKKSHLKPLEEKQKSHSTHFFKKNSSLILMGAGMIALGIAYSLKESPPQQPPSRGGSVTY